MTRRPVIVVACTAVAAVAGVWAGGAVTPSPHPSAPLTSLELARAHARATLRSAATAEEQRASERQLAVLHRDAARALPAQRAPLERAADAYASLAAASTQSAYSRAANAVNKAETAVSATLDEPTGGDPAIPPALPLILLAAGAAGFAVSSRRRIDLAATGPAAKRAGPITAVRATTQENRVRDTPSQPKLTWDSPPPGL